MKSTCAYTYRCVTNVPRSELIHYYKMNVKIKRSFTRSPNAFLEFNELTMQYKVSYVCFETTLLKPLRVQDVFECELHTKTFSVLLIIGKYCYIKRDTWGVMSMPCIISVNVSLASNGYTTHEVRAGCSEPYLSRSR